MTIPDRAPFLRLLVAAWLMVAACAGAAEYPAATPTNTGGLVRSPRPPNRLVDVKGYEPGSLVRDPVSMKIFRVPEIVTLGRDRYRAEYLIGYEVANPSRRLTGTSRVRVTLEDTPEGLRLTSIEEN